MSKEKFLTLHGPSSTTMIRVSGIVVVARGPIRTMVSLTSGEVVNFDHPDGDTSTFDAISEALAGKAVPPS